MLRLSFHGRLENGITVLVPAYNHESYLAECLDSILAQDIAIPVYIYVFVDKSENPKTLEIAKEYEFENPSQVSVFDNPMRLGSGTASFLYHRPGVNTKYWCILEGDDYWISCDRLKKMSDALAGSPDAVGVCTKFMIQKPDGRITGPVGPDYTEYNLLGKIHYSSRIVSYAHTSSILWKNLFCFKGMPLPRRYYKLMGDPGLEQSMLRSSGKMICLSAVGSLYRLTGKGRWSSLTEEEMRQANLIAAKRWKRNLPLNVRVSLFLLEASHSKDLCLVIFRILSRIKILPRIIANSENLKVG